VSVHFDLPPEIKNLRVMLLIVAPKGAQALHDILVTSTMRAPMSFFEKHDTSVMLNRFSQDMTLLDLQLPMSTFVVFGGTIAMYFAAYSNAFSHSPELGKHRVHLHRLHISCGNSPNHHDLLVHYSKVLSEDVTTNAVARPRGEKPALSAFH
jgi:ABC-type multidrug transport system fused ATPase/permease subunit